MADERQGLNVGVTVPCQRKKNEKASTKSAVDEKTSFKDDKTHQNGNHMESQDSKHGDNENTLEWRVSMELSKQFGRSVTKNEIWLPSISAKEANSTKEDLYAKMAMKYMNIVLGEDDEDDRLATQAQENALAAMQRKQKGLEKKRAAEESEMSFLRDAMSAISSDTDVLESHEQMAMSHMSSFKNLYLVDSE